MVGIPIVAEAPLSLIVLGLRYHCKLDAEGKGYLEHAMAELNFSARAHDRILKVSRTLADLAGKENITGNEVLEVIQFRSLDSKLFF